eukprot:802218-Pyramimonas_sp.AAC.1
MAPRGPTRAAGRPPTGSEEFKIIDFPMAHEASLTAQTRPKRPSRGPQAAQEDPRKAQDSS